METTAFDQFGELLMNTIRDKQIRDWDDMVAARNLGAYWEQFEAVFQSFTEEQKLVLNKLGVEFIDSILHDLLFLFETTEWVKIRLETKEEIMEDIRRASKGDLQGYFFIWAEKYSKFPLSIP